MDPTSAPVLRRSARTASIDASASIAEQVTPRKTRATAAAAAPVEGEDAAKPSSRKPLLDAIPEEQDEPASPKPATRKSTRNQKPVKEEEEKPVVATRKSTRGKAAAAAAAPEKEEQPVAAELPKSTRRTRSASIAVEEEVAVAVVPPKSTRRTRSSSVAEEELEELPLAPPPGKSNRKTTKVEKPVVQSPKKGGDDDGNEGLPPALELNRQALGDISMLEEAVPSPSKHKAGRKSSSSAVAEIATSGAEASKVASDNIAESAPKQAEETIVKSTPKSSKKESAVASETPIVQEPMVSAKSNKKAKHETPKLASAAEEEGQAAAVTVADVAVPKSNKKVKQAAQTPKPEAAVVQEEFKQATETPKPEVVAEAVVPKSNKKAKQAAQTPKPEVAVAQEESKPEAVAEAVVPKSSKKAKQAAQTPKPEAAVQEEPKQAAETPKPEAAAEVVMPKSSKKAKLATPKPEAAAAEEEPKPEAAAEVAAPKSNKKVKLATPKPEAAVVQEESKPEAVADVAAPKSSKKAKLTTPKSTIKGKQVAEELALPNTPFAATAASALEAPQLASSKKDKAPASSIKKAQLQPGEEKHEQDAAMQILGDVAKEMKRSTVLHRGKFVEFKPEGVEALAGKGNLLAVARSSGEVEIWERRNQVLQQRVIIPGTKSQSLRCLCWFENRLFGGNLNGSLFEVDFARTLSQIPCEVGGGGGVWSMDANAQYILTACEDGRVRLYQPSAMGFGLDYIKSLSGGSNSRLLCVKVHGANDNLCYTSGMDGAIRKWDLKARRVVDQIMVPTAYATRQVMVWTLDTFGESLACGDSLGRVHIWKDDQSTPQSFREHRGDVLAVKFAAQGTSLFASGVDSRLALFRLLPEATKDWVYVYSHRAHTHDVRALGLFSSPAAASSGSSAEEEEVIVSAGVDTQLSWYPVRTFEQVRPKKESLYRQTQCITAAAEEGSDSHLLLVQHTYHLDVWRIQSEDKSQVHLATINFDGDSCLRQAALSKSGGYIACILLNQLLVFKLTLEEGEGGSRVTAIKRLGNLPRINDALSLCFTSDSLLLVSTFQGGVLAVDVDTEEIVSEAEGGSVLTNLCKSGDGQWIAGTVLAGTTISSAVFGPEAVEIFNLDVMRRHELLPSALFGQSGHAALAFSACSKRLVVARLDGSIHVVDIDARRLAADFPQLHSSFPDRVLGITFNPAEPTSVTVWSWAHIAVLGQLGKPRVLKKCKPLVFASFLGPDKLLVLEAPFVNAFKFLPDVVERERFGT